MVREVEARSTPVRRPDRHPLPTGWAAADAVLGSAGLARGAVHEWLGVETRTPGEASTPEARPPRRRDWIPPISVLIHLARRALAEDPVEERWLIWIGRRIQPYPRALADSIGGGGDGGGGGESEEGASPLARSLFVDPPTAADRVWAADLALRCGAASCVVLDASGLPMAESRRLQLAAASGDALALLARPAWEAGRLSAARTRWLVRTASEGGRCVPSWSIELLRLKGVRSPMDAHSCTMTTHDAFRFTACHDGASAHGDLAADAHDRPAAPTRSPVRRTA